MRLRHHALTPILAAATLFGVGLLPREARAVSLQDCPPAPGQQARLPIGYGGSNPTQLYAEKKELRDYIASLNLTDVDLPTPRPDFLNPVDVYHLTSGTQNTGGNCAPWVSLPTSLPPQDAQELERLWLMWSHYKDTNDIPAFYMLGFAPQEFLLSTMEDANSCNAITPQMDWDPMVSWLANWEYPGNPYYTDSALRDSLRKRGASWLALQLIMLDWNAWAGVLPTAPPVGTVFAHPPVGLPAPTPGSFTINFGYELAGYLGHMAYTYLQVKDVLPTSTQQAMETMLRMYAERLDLWTPYSQLLNLGIRSTYAFYLTWLATNDNAILTYYQNTLDGFYGNQSAGRWFSAGYFADDGRYDSGYNGWNILHTLRLLQLDPSPAQEVIDAGHNLFDLQAHLTFRDPDNSWYSPNEFNTRSSAGAISGVLGGSSRASAGGGIGRYLPALKPQPGMPNGLPYAYAFMRDANLIGPQSYSPWVNNGRLDPNDSLFHHDLICQLSDVTGWFTLASRNFPNWYVNTPTPWPAPPGDRDYGTPLFAMTLFESPDLQTWVTEAQNNPQLEDFPFEAEGPYTRSFDDEFVYARFGGPSQAGYPYATMIHAGPVSAGDAWVGSALQPGFIPAGFGGGQIAMFWGPHTGAALRGMRRGYNNDPGDDWIEWSAWPMHAVSLVSTAGDWTSSSRIITPSTDVTYYDTIPYEDQLNWDIDQYPCPGTPVPAVAWSTPPTTTGAAVLVRVCGDIPDQVRRFTTIAPQVLSAPMPYSRTIYADENGMIVRTKITPSAADQFNEAWETIPVYDQHWPTVTNYASAEIYMVDAYGVLTMGTGGVAPVKDIVQVYVTRADGAFQILFDQPQWVGVSGDWIKGNAKSNNIMVDLGRNQLPGALPGPNTIGYRIEMLTDSQGNTQPL